MALSQLESKEQFEQAIKGDEVLVQFFAEWCSPCRQIAPAINKISEERNVIKIDVDKFPDIATKYVIMTIPHLIDFREGQRVKESIGVKPKAALLRDFTV